jgi:hypothetical protein
MVTQPAPLTTDAEELPGRGRHRPAADADRKQCRACLGDGGYAEAPVQLRQIGHHD